MSGADDALTLLRDSAGAVAPRGGDLRRIRALRYHPPGFDRAMWQTICDLGWPGLRLAETDGGAGLDMRAYCALAEELGRGLVPEPLIACTTAASLLRGAALSALLAGESIVIPAWQERANTLAATGDTRFSNGRVQGRKLFVPLAAGADAFLVTTNNGCALVRRDAPGLRLETVTTQDGGHFGTLLLDDAAGEPVDGDVAAALEEATLATAAYLLGLMDGVFALTLDYLRTRQQFGAVIGSFQALQHRAADLKLQIELTRASIASAAATLDGDAAMAVQHAAVSRAKARASDAALVVTRQAIQLHGGIGYTDEHDAGLYLRRAMVLANLHGSAAVHRARYAALAGEED